jgi:beta-aspartyl-dipeptidase (metallo-type)
MLTVLRNCHVFSPGDQGVKDILIAGERIALLTDRLPVLPLTDVLEVDCAGRRTIPGFVDSHVHFLGGGGSNGAQTRGPELKLTEFTLWGTTTAVGLLGADGLTRDLAGLLAKARALEFEGMSTYILIGAYDVPYPTFTGSLKQDMFLVDKALGAGEIAIADARSSQPTLQEIIRLGADANIGGRLTGRGGVVNVHLGVGKGGLRLLMDAIERSDLPASVYVPTHCNRMSAILDQSIAWAARGGPIDLTTIRRTPGAVPVPDAVRYLLSKGVPVEAISLSTDGGGVFPHLTDERGNPEMAIWETRMLYFEFKSMLDAGLGLDVAIQVASTNPAKTMRLYPRKGGIAKGSDADMIVLHDDGSIDKVVARGRLMVDGGRALVKGLFEVSPS